MIRKTVSVTMVGKRSVSQSSEFSVVNKALYTSEYGNNGRKKAQIYFFK